MGCGQDGNRNKTLAIKHRAGPIIILLSGADRTRCRESYRRVGIAMCPGRRPLNPSGGKGARLCAAGPGCSRAYGGIGGDETASCTDGGTSYIRAPIKERKPTTRQTGRP
ncbi:hypothetical protein NDU88_006411 [Pleurodeles waltl]|uniref:Uncharacterized protein n=1 Tax=Pleurodeles waltl TaxID=8319 RepID=A0AAV7LP16_PLEWA|nr:hypothetical protein NDU88_006411 [Pleurodeles waltl]